MSSNGDLFELLISELSELVIVLIDKDGKFRSWNPGVQRQFGYAQEEFIGQHLSLLLPEAERNWGTAERELNVAAEAGRASDTRWLARKDGQHVFAHGVTIGLRDSAGKPAGFGKVIRDVTARRKAEEELERAHQRLKDVAGELERSNEELEEFARIASHDLSAPIMSTRWLVDLLSARYSSGLDADGQKCLKQIILGLERMADLVEAVLAHAHVGRGVIGSMDPIRAEDALAAALENLQKDIAVSGASIHCEPLPELFIQAQPLTRLFQNLLSNAMKYRRPDVPVEIRITAAKRDGMWQISVADNGIGIPPEWFERIFQPLQRRHGLEVPGSGIGLATCKKIVTRAGGAIWVDSVVGNGSTFHFTLPGVPAQQVGQASSDNSDGAGKTIG